MSDNFESDNSKSENVKSRTSEASQQSTHCSATQAAPDSGAEQPRPHVDTVLDATGLRCPEPIMLLHNAVRDCEAGDVIQLISTDPSSERDVEKFCLYLKHTLLASEIDAEQKRYVFFIKKGHT